MKFLIVCGGSAGHINPAIAIAEELHKKSPEFEILFAGAGKTLEKRLIPEAGFDLVNIKMSGLRRGFSPRDILHNIRTIWNLFTAGFRSAKLLKEFKPNAVIGTGGYISYPVLRKARAKGIRTYVLEPNASPGLAVRMLSGIVDKIFVTYKDTEDKYKHPKRVIYTGTPLRSGFLSSNVITENAALYTTGKSDVPIVVSFWGSVGATGMNNKIFDFIERNVKEDKFKHIHAAGISGNAEAMKERLKNLGVTEAAATLVDIREYIDDMPSVMGEADIIISRSGASTIAELTAIGRPAILIPSPNVTENHQEENARQLQKAGGAVMILEKDCTGDTLFEVVSSLLENKEGLKKMSDALKSLLVSDATARIVDTVLKDSKT